MRAPGVRGVHLRGALLFVQVTNDVLTLDAIAVDPVRGDNFVLDRGEPFALTAHLPATAWSGAALSTLVRWAEAGEVVDFDISGGRGSARLRASDGQTGMLLDG